MSDIIDHKALAISRLATQYRESANLIDYIRTLLLEADTLEEVYQDLLTERWLDTAVGVQLDILGAIVGQPRTLIDSSVLTFFGFDTAPGAGSFGDENNTGLGARFRADGESTTGVLRLSDPEYRVFVKAKVLKNVTDCTADDVAEHVRFLTSAPTAYVIDVGPATAQVNIGRLLNDNEKIFVKDEDIIPKPAGVAYTFVEYEGNDAFAFAGVPGTTGFGDETDPTVGGSFASEF